MTLTTLLLLVVTLHTVIILPCSLYKGSRVPKVGHVYGCTIEHQKGEIEWLHTITMAKLNIHNTKRELVANRRRGLLDREGCTFRDNKDKMSSSGFRERS